MLKKCLCLLFAALLFGCANQPTAKTSEFADVKAADSPKKVCTTETKTGSFIPKRVCRTKAQMEEEEEFAEKVLDKVRSSPNLTP